MKKKLNIMKSDRLLSTLMLLQAHGRLSTRELAERLEISQRTAHRDMEALSAAGVPILALRGAQGGWELAKGWRTKVPGLDEAELRALLMSQPSALGHPALAAASERAFGKLLAAMPQKMQTQAASIRARLHIDPVGWHPSSNDLSLLPVVQDAIARDCKLTFLYSRADGESGVRTVDPYGIVSKQATWYLVARAPAGMRTYRYLAHAECGGAGYDVRAAGELRPGCALEERNRAIATETGAVYCHAGDRSRCGCATRTVVPSLTCCGGGGDSRGVDGAARFVREQGGGAIHRPGVWGAGAGSCPGEFARRSDGTDADGDQASGKLIEIHSQLVGFTVG